VQRFHGLVAAIALVVPLTACGGSTFGTAEQFSLRRSVSAEPGRAQGRRACPETTPEKAQCGVIFMRSAPRPDLAGWAPSDLQAAYNLPSSSNGSGQIVAIVDAYDDPNVTSDLAAYRSYFGLPPANFMKYNQRGQQSNYPAAKAEWGLEIDLDVEMVSAVCPNCTIYLIEADDGNNLGTAEREAVKLGAHIISNSWFWSTVPESDFQSQGVVYLAASGDSGYAANKPAEFPNVVSVGGTVLAKHGKQYKEIVWPFTGGGCAGDVAKPSWQHDPSCTSRMQNDVAAVALDVAEYDSYGYGGWITIAGTSVATPLIAGIYGLAGNANVQHAGKAFWILTNQQRKKYLHVISEGSNGDCGGSYLCAAGTRQFSTYSGPTGWGTPNGIGAF
jgi:subtilase family serine protease